MDELTLTFLRLGALIAFASLGLNLLYGVVGVVNLAHGEVVALGAVLVALLAPAVGLLPAVLLTLALAAIAGVLLGRLLFRPLRFHARGAMLATSLGLGVLLQVIYSVATKQAAISIRADSIALDGVRGVLSLLGLCAVIAGLLYFYVERTHLGRATVLVAENASLAEVWGLPVSLIYDISFGLSFLLASLSGVIVAMTYSISLGFSFKLLIWTFAAVLLGGLGKLLGGVIGSFVISGTWVLLGVLGAEPFVDALLLLFSCGMYLRFPRGLLGRTRRVL